MDCLNRFSLWDSNIGLEPDVDYYSSDYAGEVGFSVTDEDGHATFYHQHFFPEPELAASDEAEILLVLRDRNHATATLFDSYITFVQDVLRVQTTYAELLKDYLHAKRWFLSEAEIASCLMQYLRSSSSAVRVCRLQVQRKCVTRLSAGKTALSGSAKQLSLTVSAHFSIRISSVV